MKIRVRYILPILVVIAFLSGFKSDKDFPAPINEPSAAIYLNISSSGIFDEENKSACEEIADNVANICNLRDSSQKKINKDYKKISLDFLNDSIISGFLKIQEVYFYYKNTDEYALIANGNFDLEKIAKKLKSEIEYNEENKIIKITTLINDLDKQNANYKIYLQADENKLILCPEKTISKVAQNINASQNLLGNNFKTFEKMVQYKPAISAEINIEKLIKEQTVNNVPKSLSATKLVRLFIAPHQNKMQFSIPDEQEREEIKKELQNQTVNINSIFENKTDYKLKEGKTSIFLESKANDEQVKSISRKTMAFILHFFVKNIP